MQAAGGVTHHDFQSYWEPFGRGEGGAKPLRIAVCPGNGEAPVLVCSQDGCAIYDDEEAFQDAAGYVEHAPFASSNLDTIARRGILADTWLPPAPEPWERLQLRRLVKVQLFR